MYNYVAEILQPAINGTLNVLLSCTKNQSLRRMVLASSSSTVRKWDDFNPRLQLDESSWNCEELYKSLKVHITVARSSGEWSFLAIPVKQRLLLNCMHCRKFRLRRQHGNSCEDNIVTIILLFVIQPSLPPFLSSTSSSGVFGLLKGVTEKFE